LTEAVQIAIIASVAPTIAALGGGFVLYRQGREIHVLVNSNMNKALAEIQSLKDTLAQKQAVIDTTATEATPKRNTPL
jgi:hypothetical protein